MSGEDVKWLLAGRSGYCWLLAGMFSDLLAPFFSHSSFSPFDYFTRLGSCTGDLRSCANVPSMGGPTLCLNVVLCLFWQHQFGSKGKNPGGRCFMGAPGQNWPFPPRAYKGVRTSARPQFCTQSHRKPTMQPPAPLGKAYKVLGRTF